MQIGTIQRNEDIVAGAYYPGMTKKPNFGTVYFDQSSWGALDSGISYEVPIARKLKDNGIAPIIALPFGGIGGFMDIREGRRIDITVKALRAHLASFSPTNTGKIPLRLQWEGNLLANFQTQSAQVAINGAWKPDEWIQSFRFQALIAREISPRFQIVHGPNIGGNDLKPDLIYPGDDVVDLYGCDWYSYTPGRTFAQNLNPVSGYGIQWFYDQAVAHGKPCIWPEWGVVNDGDFQVITDAITWAKTKPNMHSIHYWNRNDGPWQCALSTRPQCAAAYNAAIAQV